MTGKGNIAASRKHAIHVAQDAVEAFLGLGEEAADDEFAGIANPRVAQAHETANHIASQLAETEAPDPPTRDEILRRVLKLVRRLHVDDAAVRATLDRFGPFAATESVLIAASKVGGDRQSLHEAIRGHAMSAWAAIERAF